MQVGDTGPYGAAGTPYRAPVEITDVPTAVYRFYDTAGRLLYVGITCNLALRFAQHASDKTWWPHVARKTVVLYGSRDEAAAEEERAILGERPVHNVVGRQPKRKHTRPPKRPRPVPAPKIEGPDTFVPDEVFLESIDAIAEKRQVSRGHAIGQLVFSGLVRDHYLTNGTMEDLDAEMAAMIAYREAHEARQPA